jgi:hypothetical protein
MMLQRYPTLAIALLLSVASAAVWGCSDDESTPAATGPTTSDGGSGTAGGATGATGAVGGAAAGGGTAGAGGVVEVPSCVDLPSTRVIGNWDLVPFERIEGTFNLGVVAFHELGVDVRFAVDGTEVADVQLPTFNDRTGVHEYWFGLEVADYPDGPITVTATIVPDCPGHQERELEPITLYANAGGSLTNSAIRWADCTSGDDATGDGSEGSPYQTIEKAFVEVGCPPPAMTIGPRCGPRRVCRGATCRS